MCENNDIDFLDEVVQERSVRNPAFPVMVEEAYRRRALLRQIAEARKAARLSRTSARKPPNGRHGP